jgi:thiamine-phosphate pyrophosphorylase
MHLYYITDRNTFPGTEAARQLRLLEKISEAANAGVDYIQLREKDLPSRDLETLASEAVRIVRATGGTTRLLLNSRTDIALAVQADGVHLRSDDIFPREVARIRSLAKDGNLDFLTAVSCHSAAEVRRAEQDGADFAVLAPIFGKQDPSLPSLGLEPLNIASQGKLPIIALGGITLENARACRKAGAAGIAAIRLFQENNIEQVANQLRRG